VACFTREANDSQGWRRRIPIRNDSRVGLSRSDLNEQKTSEHFVEALDDLPYEKMLALLHGLPVGAKQIGSLTRDEPLSTGIVSGKRVPVDEQVWHLPFNIESARKR
jgi:hypothetical protein